MPSKYELSISADYCENWTYLDAVRELFQNALDQQTENPDNKMYFEYFPDKELLLIGNKKSYLPITTLLLGNTTKRNNPDAIGSHGEGYKIGVMVLLREGKKVTFLNNGTNEIWTTKLVKSKKYVGHLIPTFFVDKQSFVDKTTDNDLLIKVEGITPEEFAEIEKSNLNLYDDLGELHETPYGTILLDEEFKGKVFVKGLYVCSNSKLVYGYNVKPAYLKLDRDRKAVSSFDLGWETSRMWSVIKDGTAFTLLSQKALDTEYLNSFIHSETPVVKEVYSSFTETHGADAVPVTNNLQFEEANKNGHKAIFVDSVLKSVIEQSIEFQQKIKDIEEENKNEDEEITAKQRLINWYDKASDDLSSEDCIELEAIIEMLED